MERHVGDGTEGRREGERVTAPLRRLVWEIMRKRVLIMVRYRMNFLAQIVAAYLFFAVIFFGGQAVVAQVGSTPRAIGSTLDGVIVGWFLYMMAQAAYFSLPSNVTSESDWGTLEQLYMSPYGFGTVMAAKVVVNVLHSVLLGVVMLALMLLTTGRTLSIDVLTVAPVALLGIASVVGIGFFFAGLALIYKRIESVSQLMQFVLVGLIAAPVTDVPWLRFLPLVQGSALLQRAMRDGTRIWEFSPLALAILVGTAFAYAIVGYVAFVLCCRLARRRGVMGHY